MQTGIRLISSHAQSLWLASRSWKKYLSLKQDKQAVRPKRVLADFLVGAHATVHANLFLTRDKEFYRSYFQNLKIEEPH